MKTADEFLASGQRNLPESVAYCLTLQEQLAQNIQNSNKPPTHPPLPLPIMESVDGKNSQRLKISWIVSKIMNPG